MDVPLDAKRVFTNSAAGKFVFGFAILMRLKCARRPRNPLPEPTFESRSEYDWCLWAGAAQGSDAGARCACRRRLGYNQTDDLPSNIPPNKRYTLAPALV